MESSDVSSPVVPSHSSAVRGVMAVWLEGLPVVGRPMAGIVRYLGPKYLLPFFMGMTVGVIGLLALLRINAVASQVLPLLGVSAVCGPTERLISGSQAGNGVKPLPLETSLGRQMVRELQEKSLVKQLCDAAKWSRGGRHAEACREYEGVLSALSAQATAELDATVLLAVRQGRLSSSTAAALYQRLLKDYVAIFCAEGGK